MKCTSEFQSESTTESISDISSENSELFKDNMDCIDGYKDDDIQSSYEIINESKCIPIKNRYRKQTWYEYFRKVYMVSMILIISTVIYIYYVYKQTDKLNKL